MEREEVKIAFVCRQLFKEIWGQIDQAEAARIIWTMEVFSVHMCLCKKEDVKTCLCAEENKQVGGERLLLHRRDQITRKAKFFGRQERLWAWPWLEGMVRRQGRGTNVVKMINVLRG